MIKLIPIKWLVSTPIFLAFSIKYIWEFIATKSSIFEAYFGKVPTTAWIATLTVFLITLLLTKPVWKLIWKICWLGSWLSENIFPDLNGEWDLHVTSNFFPTLFEMKNALNEKNGLPLLEAEEKFEKIELIANISQGWFKSNMIINVEKTYKDNRIVLDTSRTFSFDFIPPCDANPHRITYVYEQINDVRKIKSSDVERFFGAGRLEVLEKGNLLKGIYFTDRNWVKGLNTAGTITLTRRK